MDECKQTGHAWPESAEPAVTCTRCGAAANTKRLPFSMVEASEIPEGFPADKALSFCEMAATICDRDDPDVLCKQVHEANAWAFRKFPTHDMGPGSRYLRISVTSGAAE